MVSIHPFRPLWHWSQVPAEEKLEVWLQRRAERGSSTQGELDKDAGEHSNRSLYDHEAPGQSNLAAS